MVENTKGKCRKPFFLYSHMYSSKRNSRTINSSLSREISTMYCQTSLDFHVLSHPCQPYNHRSPLTSREGNALLGFVETKESSTTLDRKRWIFLKAGLTGVGRERQCKTLPSQWSWPWKSGFRMKMRGPGLCHVTTGAEQEPAAKPLEVKQRNFVCLGTAISCKTRALSAKEQSSERRFMPS